MDSYVIVKYLHYLGILAVVSAVVAEHLLLDKSLTRKAIKRIATLDGIYGFGAILTLGAGLTLWFGVGKPAEFYTTNGLFHIKVTLFVIVGLLSIVPTVFFIKNRKGDPDEVVEIPKKIVMMIRMELLILFILPLLGTLIALGKGM